MSSAVRRYRRDVARRLRCPRRRELLGELDRCLGAYLEDVPSPDASDLIAALGSPEDLANSLMEDIPQARRERFARSSRAVKLAGIALGLAAAVSLAVLGVRAIADREVPDDETVIFAFSNSLMGERVSANDELTVEPGVGGAVRAEKVRVIKYMGDEIARVTVSSLFRFDGKTVSAEPDAATGSAIDGWELSREPVASESGAVSLRASVSDPDKGSVSFTLTVTCDENGNIT